MSEEVDSQLLRYYGGDEEEDVCGEEFEKCLPDLIYLQNFTCSNSSATYKWLK